MQNIFYYIRSQFQRANNGLIQIMLLQSITFIGFRVIKVVGGLTGQSAFYQQLQQRLVLPMAWDWLWQQPWSLLTYFWWHTDFFSLLWHLLALYTFGRIIMDLLSSRHFVSIYLLSGVLGGLGCSLLYRFVPTLQPAGVVLLGASGSLYAMIMAAATLAPHFSLRLFLLGPVQMRYIAWTLLFLAFYELADAEPAYSLVRLLCALVGYSYVKTTYQQTRGNRFRSFLQRFRRKRLKVRHNPKASPTTPKPDATVDTILDKIADSGYESLTEREQRQLFEGDKDHNRS